MAILESDLFGVDWKTATAEDIKEVEDVKQPGKYGATPLHCAAKFSKNPKVIEALLNAGAESNARDEYDITPLHYAAGYNENPEVIKVLLNAGAYINARDRLNGSTPLHGAAMYNQNPVVIEALLKAGANVNVWNKDGKTPLHVAVRENKNLAVVALVNAGANPNAKDDKGKTPIDYIEEDENHLLKGISAYWALSWARNDARYNFPSD